MLTTSFFEELRCYWSAAELQNLPYVCGFCGRSVASHFGMGLMQNPSDQQIGGVYICPHCNSPTAFDDKGRQFPSPAFGNPVTKVPKTLNALYEEARRCTASNCHTAAVLLCRKMLMNIAVEKGEKAGRNFADYVEFLSDKGYVPPDGKHWVDHIRKKGNKATHEIEVMTANDAKELILFIEMLLRFIYAFPEMVSHGAKLKSS